VGFIVGAAAFSQQPQEREENATFEQIYIKDN